MPQVKADVETFARIKVVGIGGSGNNAIDHMINNKVKGVEFIAINTDAQDLHNSQAKKKIHIGKNLTKGLGAGMNPEIGKRAIEETKEEIQEAIKGGDMIFITCGLGGGTGSGASPIAAQIAKESTALTVAVVTKPFFFEGQHRMRIAEAALDELRKEVDAIIVIPNDRLLSNISKETSAKSAFSMCDDVLKQAVEGISDLITTPGIINIDFADVRAVLKDSGSALMGVGFANGEKRAEEAAKIAINSPLLDLSITGAKGVLFSIAGGDDLTMFEIQEAAKVITESIDQDAKVIFGTVSDPNMKKGDVKVTIIASGFPESAHKKSLFGNNNSMNNRDFSNNSFGEDNNSNSMESAQPKEKGGIFNSLSKKEESNNKSEEIKESHSKAENRKIQPIENKRDDNNDDDDDWGAVPAFLRRSKLK